MKELSLFTGAGGGLLGTSLLGWQHIGYVEFDDYCQKVIAQRIKDGILNEAPIFSDVRTFISEGFAESYQGMVDVITAGFPCQPFSVAGKQLGEKDERNMWPATCEIIRLVRPQAVMLENVPGLLSNGYFGRILSDLSESGYDARWKVISAAEVGAPHKRDRLWIVGYSKHNGQLASKVRESIEKRNGNHKTGKIETSELKRSSVKYENVAYASSRESGIKTERERRESVSGRGKEISNADKPRCKKLHASTITNKQGFNTGLPTEGSAKLPNSSCKRETERWDGITRNIGKDGKKRSNNRRGKKEHVCGQWWSVEPELGRVAHGVDNRVDRLKAIGNGQVPAVVRAAWELLNQ